MRILFYLPVATPAWLDTIGMPLVEAAAGEAETHVILPAAWLGTGLDRAEFERRSAASAATWHLFDDAGHARLRTGPADPEPLLRLVQAIGPDYSFCRSADVRTPQLFPGRSAFLMEADYPPFPPRGRIRVSGTDIFSHGTLPALEAAQLDLLRSAMQPLREAQLAASAGAAEARARFLTRAGLPADRPILGIPLEHDGAENFYMLHSPEPANAAFVERLSAALDDRVLLALTLHPSQRTDQASFARLARLQGDRVRIVEGSDGTAALARHCDAMAFRDSKSFAWAALFGKPILRISRFASAGWLNACAKLGDFATALASGAARGPDAEAALLWLGVHLANDALQPAEGGPGLAALIDRAENPVDPRRWPAALDDARADIAAAAAAIRSVGA